MSGLTYKKMQAIAVLVVVAVIASAFGEDASPPALQDSLVTWSKQLRECHGDEDCYEEADDVLRPAVRQAIVNEELPEILSCLDGWGVYDVPTEGREWNVKANLPC